ncbi:hypothetical protein [Tardiphaga sp.]|jgi:hypothetical protein|uniref:hypothetical protein n=1 Tax=Tardiphaga sp. TaxID=1926292 RepID=UPI0037DA4129
MADLAQEDILLRSSYFVSRQSLSQRDGVPVLLAAGLVERLRIGLQFDSLRRELLPLPIELEENLWLTSRTSGSIGF